MFKMSEEEADLFESNLGSFEFGMPCEAVQYRGPAMEKVRRKIKLMNLLMISYGKNHPFIKLGLKDRERPLYFNTDNTDDIEEDIYEDKKDDTGIKEVQDIIDDKGVLYQNEQFTVLESTESAEKKENDEKGMLQRRQLIMDALEKRMTTEVTPLKNEEDEKKNQ